MNPRFRFPSNQPLPPGPYRTFRGHGTLWWVHDLIALAIVVAVIVGVVLLVRMFLNRPHGPGRWTHHPAMHELDLRYARGEIDRIDYMQRRADIAGWAPSVTTPSAAPPRPGGRRGAAPPPPPPPPAAAPPPPTP